MIKMLVCGGREFDDLQLFIDVMKSIEEKKEFAARQPVVIIEGGAKGADFLARCWAKYCGYQHEPYPADWKKYGRSAGYIRNKQMLDEGRPDFVVAFPGGSGTEDMVQQTRARSIEVIEIGEQ